MTSNEMYRRRMGAIFLSTLCMVGFVYCVLYQQHLYYKTCPVGVLLSGMCIGASLGVQATLDILSPYK